jgi:xylulokinase
LLAQVGTGAFQSVPEACDATIRAVDSTRVDPSTKAYYDRAFPIYRQLYCDLRDSFQTISSLVAYHAHE